MRLAHLQLMILIANTTARFHIFSIGEGENLKFHSFSLYNVVCAECYSPTEHLTCSEKNEKKKNCFAAMCTAA